MRHRCRWCGSVPVLLVRREPDHITRPDLLNGSAFMLSPAAACRDNERLPQRMGVPCSPRTGLKRDTGALNQCGIGRLEQRIDPNGASKPIRRPFTGSLRANSFDIHLMSACIDHFTFVDVWAKIDPMQTHRIAVIAGDGVGQEIIPEAKRLLARLQSRHRSVSIRRSPLGFRLLSAARKHGAGGFSRQAAQSEAILLGAVGHPKVPDHITLNGLLLPIRRTFDSMQISGRPGSTKA